MKDYQKVAFGLTAFAMCFLAPLLPSVEDDAMFTNSPDVLAFPLGGSEECGGSEESVKKGADVLAFPRGDEPKDPLTLTSNNRFEVEMKLGILHKGDSVRVGCGTRSDHYVVTKPTKSEWQVAKCIEGSHATIPSTAESFQTTVDTYDHLAKSFGVPVEDPKPARIQITEVPANTISVDDYTTFRTQFKGLPDSTTVEFVWHGKKFTCKRGGQTLFFVDRTFNKRRRWDTEREHMDLHDFKANLWDEAPWDDSGTYKGLWKEHPNPRAQVIGDLSKADNKEFDHFYELHIETLRDGDNIWFRYRGKEIEVTNVGNELMFEDYVGRTYMVEITDCSLSKFKGLVWDRIPLKRGEVPIDWNSENHLPPSVLT